jgi:hypothetical protein
MLLSHNPSEKLIYSRGANKQPKLRQQLSSNSNFTININAKKAVENFMTLKQACSSEYQGAQGAFKDSMIH